MGLSVYYSGRLRDSQLLDVLVKETANACLCVGWRFDFLKRSNIMPMKGIIINPEGCEPIMLTFTQDGNLANPIRFMLWEDPGSMEVFLDEDGICFTKTQYAGADCHIAIIKFLKYITEKYFAEFRLVDESRYWDHNDDDTCRNRFGGFELVLDTFDEAHKGLTCDDDDEEDNLEFYSYAVTMDEWIREKVSAN